MTLSASSADSYGAKSSIRHSRFLAPRPGSRKYRRCGGGVCAADVRTSLAPIRRASPFFPPPRRSQIRRRRDAFRSRAGTREREHLGPSVRVPCRVNEWPRVNRSRFKTLHRPPLSDGKKGPVCLITLLRRLSCLKNGFLTCCYLNPVGRVREREEE